MDMIGPIKGRPLEVRLFRNNMDRTDKESLNKFGLGTWSVQR